MKNMTKDPAIAKEEISMPNTAKIEAPKNKKLTIIITDTIVAVEACIAIPSFFMLIITGSEPTISITENKIIATVKIEVMFMR